MRQNFQKNQINNVTNNYYGTNRHILYDYYINYVLHITDRTNNKSYYV